jgi:hypothetical protein
MIVAALVWTAFLGAQHDDFRYHFDNDSSWDTAFLVPHFFEQTYAGTKPLLGMRASSSALEFEIAVTPVRGIHGSDFDTFFQPTGDVVVHGGAATVESRSINARWTYTVNRLRIGMDFQRDQMKFPTSISTTTHTMPPSHESNVSDTRETTRSDVLEVRVGSFIERQPTPALRLRGTLDLAPIASARLTTFLPDKYPDLAIKFDALSWSVTADAEAEWRAGRVGVVLGGRAALAEPYRTASAFRRRQIGATLALRFW